MDALRERVETVKRTAIRLPTIRVFALEWSSPPWVAGHWVPEMVEAVGAVNLLNEKGEPSREVGWREVADAMPEVVVFMPCGYYLEEAEQEAPALWQNPDFAGTAAAGRKASSRWTPRPTSHAPARGSSTAWRSSPGRCTRRPIPNRRKARSPASRGRDAELTARVLRLPAVG